MEGKLNKRGRSIALLVVGVMIGGLLITPAGAHVGGTVGHLWKKHMLPLAKKAFYTKAQTDAKYLGKTAKAADADKLDGLDSLAFLRVDAKAADSDKLDGISSEGFYAAGSKVANSDLLDGSDSTAFVRFGQKATDSDRLDGFDSTRFAALSAHNQAYTDECDVAGTWNQCAQVTINVPSGRTFNVSAWTTATIAGNGTAQDVTFCTARRLSTDTTPSCITPFGIHSRVTVPASGLISAASSGETTVGAGSWVFSFGLNPPAQVGFHDYGKVVTKVLVRDAATGSPLSVSSVKVTKASTSR